MDFSSVFACPVLRYGGIGRGPSANQMDGPSARLRIVGTTHRLAVYGHHLAGHEGRHRLGPLHETALELLRVQPGENVAEGVVGGNAVGQVQKGAEPLLLALAEHLHVDPGIRAADYGADGDCHDVQQLVSLSPLYPRALQVLKTFHDRCTLPLHHHSPSHHPDSEPNSFLDKFIIKTRLPCLVTRTG